MSAASLGEIVVVPDRAPHQYLREIEQRLHDAADTDQSWDQTIGEWVEAAVASGSLPQSLATQYGSLALQAYWHHQHLRPPCVER